MTAGVRQEPREATRPRAPRRPRLPVLLALLVGLAGVGYRLALLLADAPPTNSDEATMGLAALHIARGADFPVWFYGQAYMGTLEAYLAAPLIALAGPSVLALRLPTLALYALFLALSWRLARRLGGDRWYALLVVAVLALGSDRVLKNQLIAGGGYPELNPAAAALALLTVGLCAGGSRGLSRRAAAGGPAAGLPRWASWGFVSGLLLWVDPLILPFVLALGAVLVGWRRRDLVGRAGAALAGGLLLGAAPMLVDSLRHGRNPLAAVLTASGADAAASLGERLHGGLVLGPPLAMGFCSPGRCAGWQLWWAPTFLVLLLLAAITAWRTLRRAASPADLGEFRFPANDNSPRSGDDSAGEAGQRVSAGVRLALLAGAAAVLAAYAMSNAAGRAPMESARYLSVLAVATPALLWPLWSAARRAGLWPRPAGPPHHPGEVAKFDPAGHHLGELAGSDRPGYRHIGEPESISRAAGGRKRIRAAGVAAVAVLAGMLGTGAVATTGAVGTVPATHGEADRHRILVDALGDLNLRHVRAGYWTCNRLAFASGEEVRCAVVDDELRPGFDRLPGYRRAVGADPDAAWVAPAGSPLAARLDGRLGPGPGGLRVVDVPGWRIYLPRR
ncbi:DUF423 domain-containing protein [Micromonospora halotolerans]|uniref:DUF423 domain-containing protein n=1 Tax=Micromonospora halotolerans TaxID=709879 RepID=A0ABY9ZQ80_9ACTN|nr:DUF423 domain-containing protein [Micromonospora halotolerans]WNM37451.1 DUF423 domain-containing protein [Micromonospora halotolerans]